jgi:hypothetical protein
MRRRSLICMSRALAGEPEDLAKNSQRHPTASQLGSGWFLVTTFSREMSSPEKSPSRKARALLRTEGVEKEVCLASLTRMDSLGCG